MSLTTLTFDRVHKHYSVEVRGEKGTKRSFKHLHITHQVPHILQKVVLVSNKNRMINRMDGTPKEYPKITKMKLCGEDGDII